jgi:hypothetical protein
MVWMELILGFLIGCLIFICWLAWDMTRWGELQLDLSMEDIESDLWEGLHLQGRDK